MGRGGGYANNEITTVYITYICLCFLRNQINQVKEVGGGDNPPTITKISVLRVPVVWG